MALGNEFENLRLHKVAERRSTASVTALRPRSCKPYATNMGLVHRYGPPTDPTLDASRENDLLTQWHAPAPRPNWALRILVGIAMVALLVAAIGQLVS